MATRDPQRFAKALDRYRAAREREPVSKEAADALVKFYRSRGALWQATAGPRPEGKDGAPPDAAALARWEKDTANRRARAIADYEAALRIEPNGTDADLTRDRLEILKALDPDARRAAYAASQARFGEGQALLDAGKRADALGKFREATEEFPDHLPAWFRIAELGLDLGEEQEAEAMNALEVVRELDASSRYVRADLYRGKVWFRRWKRASRADAPAAEAERAAERASFCRRALERYVGAASGDPKEAEGLAAARVMLESLVRGGR